MPIVGGLDIHRKQLTFDYLDTVTGQVVRGRVAPAGREHLRGWLVRFAGRGDVAFAMEGCTGWRYVAAELAAAGIAVHLSGAGPGVPRAAGDLSRPAPRAHHLGWHAWMRPWLKLSTMKVWPRRQPPPHRASYSRPLW
jgi:hypothetical protein